MLHDPHLTNIQNHLLHANGIYKQQREYTLKGEAAYREYNAITDV